MSTQLPEFVDKRLCIMKALSGRTLFFNRLCLACFNMGFPMNQRLVARTAKKLEEGGYIQIREGLLGADSHEYGMTPKGIHAYKGFMKWMMTL